MKSVGFPMNLWEGLEGVAHPPVDLHHLEGLGLRVQVQQGEVRPPVPVPVNRYIPRYS